MKKLRVGIIGLGVGEAHIAGYESHPACLVTALCDFSKQKLSAAAKKYPGKRLTAKAADILKDPAIDVVSIASYDNFHHGQIVEAIRRGKHVFVEKPMCLNPKEGISIRKALEAHKKVKISSNLILRMSPRFQKLREWVRAGKFGKIYYSEGDYNYGRIHKITEGWRGRIPYYSVICGGGVHMIDLLLWIRGGTVKSVSASGTSIATRGTAFRYSDCVAALLNFTDGSIAKITSNYSCVFPHHHLLSMYGTKATFVNHYGSGKLFFSRDQDKAPEDVVQAYLGPKKGDMIPSYVRSILGQGEAQVSKEDIFKVLSVCFAIDEAAARKSTVIVRYL